MTWRHMVTPSKTPGFARYTDRRNDGQGEVDYPTCARRHRSWHPQPLGACHFQDCSLYARLSFGASLSGPSVSSLQVDRNPKWISIVL